VSDKVRDRFARDALVHVPELLRVCTRIVSDRSAAEDIVQDTCLQAWRSFHRYQPGTNCRAWLYKIMFFVLADRRRKQARTPPHTDLDAVPEPASFPDAATPMGATLEEVKAAFDRLPEPFRLVVMLADVEDHTYREIAEALEIPIGTVMSRLSRGRAQLRQELTCTMGPAIRRVR
jgi:RNA polymerase sigma-70 factor (ECF subfamily)